MAGTCQDKILTEAIHRRIPITLYTMNGVQIKGTIQAFDQFIVVLETEKGQQCIYKHAISTIVPDSKIAV